MHTYKCTAMIALTILVFNLSSPVLARDSKTYSGIECIAQVPRFAADIFYTTNGHATNIGNTAMPVVCPAVRDTSGSISAEIMVRDRSTSADIFCSLVSVAREGFELQRLSKSSAGRFSTFLPTDFDQLRARAARNSTILLI